MAKDKVGIWLVGAWGGVSTTVAVGLAALREGLADEAGLVSALPRFSGLSLIDWDRLVYRGDPASVSFMVFYMLGDKVVAANAFNLGREVRFAKRLIETRKAVADADLADENLKLKDLAA
ncbi:MAG: hypothetical protein IIA72_08080 [Proteobacteria bacterium]|nr:hypothetical protein [Pseudomonadota bacterium]